MFWAHWLMQAYASISQHLFAHSCQFYSGKKNQAINHNSNPFPIKPIPHQQLPSHRTPFLEKIFRSFNRTLKDGQRLANLFKTCPVKLQRCGPRPQKRSKPNNSDEKFTAIHPFCFVQGSRNPQIRTHK